MGLSRRAYAAHRGCSESAVRKAIATGRIATEPDGTIDPARADAMWDARTDPAQQRGMHARATAAATASATSSAKAALGKPVPLTALDAVKETLREAGSEASAGDDAGGEVSFVRARMANEVLKAQTAKVRLQKMRGEVVDRARATAMVFDLARRERDAWLNWPPRVAAMIAAELGVEAHRMETVLDRHIRAHLGELAEVKVELR
ncbi:elements of external origin [Limibaculum sp. FT325]|uniref:elements of external origin n=1 Tax=Thermohalobaculum sediminis TaxID=2939436 RepID=UPI0020C07150|nr:elements of external origin [Limibaculum sediminis]MCL5779198.1 elements of external origin [Limibaculum sediminis]